VWAAIRENEVRAEAIGFNVFRYKSLALMVSGGIAALSGAIYAPYRFAVSPDTVFTPWLSIYGIVYVVVGGLGTMSGSLLGAAIVIFLERFLIDYIGAWGHVVIGIIFIAFVLSLPYGIVGTWRAKGLSIGVVLQKFTGRKTSAK
jgi:branched-chain amino acid transport system permease protein